MSGSLREPLLRMKKVNRLELSVGAALICLSFLMPLLFNVGNIPVPYHIHRALALHDTVSLMTAALLLVALNTLRGLPHYVGAFFVSESVDFTWKGKPSEVCNAVLTIALLRAAYRTIDLVYGVHYDFGIPAMLCACSGILFQHLNYKYISRTKKAMLISIFLTAFQFFDVMPMMDRLPVGRGELSQDIKLTAQVLDCARLIDTVGIVGLLFFLLFGVLILSQLRAENNLRELNALKEQNEAIRTQAQVNEMKNRTYQEIQYLVHDLKSPLTAVQTLVGVLKMESEADKRTKDVKYLTRIEDNVEQMSNMISEILYEDRRSPITTERIVRIVLAQVSTSDYAGCIRVKNRVPQARVSVNHVLFPRALVNLLQNSARAVRERREPRIELRVAAENGLVRFTVADNGVGISPERQESVWQRGSSGASSSGLGLAFVQNTVENQGGTTTLQSRAGQGTQITITIPEEGAK